MESINIPVAFLSLLQLTHVHVVTVLVYHKVLCHQGILQSFFFANSQEVLYVRCVALPSFGILCPFLQTLLAVSSLQLQFHSHGNKGNQAHWKEKRPWQRKVNVQLECDWEIKWIISLAASFQSHYLWQHLPHYVFFSLLCLVATSINTNISTRFQLESKSLISHDVFLLQFENSTFNNFCNMFFQLYHFTVTSWHSLHLFAAFTATCHFYSSLF